MLDGLTLASAPLWRSASPGAIDSRFWGGEAVLYVVASGETHALDAATSAVFATLMEHPGQGFSVQGWFQLMAAADGSDQAPASFEELQAVEAALMVLHRLSVLDLVQL